MVFIKYPELTFIIIKLLAIVLPELFATAMALLSPTTKQTRNPIATLCLKFWGADCISKLCISI